MMFMDKNKNVEEKYTTWHKENRQRVAVFVWWILREHQTKTWKKLKMTSDNAV